MNFKALKERILSTWSGKVENAKMNFAFQMTDLMKEKSISNKVLADKLKTSAAYITKVLRGDQSLSIESIYKIADALGADVHLKMVDKNSHSLRTLNARTIQWLESISTQKSYSSKNIDLRHKGCVIDIREFASNGYRKCA